MENNELVPLDQVLTDMCEDSGLIASAAREYYISKYATPEEAYQMRKEDTRRLIFAWIMLAAVAVLLAVCVLRNIYGY